MTVAYLLKPGLCPMMPMRLEVDQKGMTRPILGVANSEVCLKSDEKGFVELLEERLAPAQR
jgi:inosine-uridine nucleoside N-ribohydrolase